MTPPDAQGAATALPAPGIGELPQAESPLRRLRARGGVLALLGPAFVAAVAYIDPGNFATNFQGGAQFGYTLAWVVVMANLMAMLVQYLSAKLGVIYPGKFGVVRLRSGGWVGLKVVGFVVGWAEHAER